MKAQGTATFLLAPLLMDMGPGHPAEVSCGGWTTQVTVCLISGPCRHPDLLLVLSTRSELLRVLVVPFVRGRAAHGAETDGPGTPGGHSASPEQPPHGGVEDRRLLQEGR